MLYTYWSKGTREADAQTVVALKSEIFLVVSTFKKKNERSEQCCTDLKTLLHTQTTCEGFTYEGLLVKYMCITHDAALSRQHLPYAPLLFHLPIVTLHLSRI